MKNQDSDKTLLIIDDCAADAATNTGRKGALAKLSNNARWRNCSMIIISQSIASITPAFRDNLEALMFFTSYKIEEREYVVREHNPCGDKNTMREIIDHAHQLPRDFMFEIFHSDGVYIFRNFHQLIMRPKKRKRED